MNFTFSDVSNSFLSMVQQDLPRELMVNSENAGFKDQMFAQKLSRTIKKSGSQKDEIPVQTEPELETAKAEKILKSLYDKLGQEKGTGYVSALKTIFLLLSNGDLKNVSIDSDGLAALKKLLLKAGFKENEIDDLMSELSEKLENDSLTLNDFFDSLFDLEVDTASEDDQEPEHYLEMSAVPFIESILTSLHVPKEKIEEILIAADRGEKGVSLDVILEKLRSLQKESFYTHTQYKTSEGDKNFDLLLKQLGVEHGSPEPSRLGLNEFVDALTKLHQKITAQGNAIEPHHHQPQNTMGDEKHFEFFKALFKGVEIKNQSGEINAFKFSYEQIKDHFEKEFIVPGNEKANRSGLLLDKKAMLDAGKNSKNGFKNVDAFLDGKKEGVFEIKEQLKSTRGGIKQFKSENARLFDQTQISSADARTGETQPNLGLLKTKATFRNLPTYVTHQVSKSIVRAINQGENTLKIQLKPPELGRLVMTIDNTGSSMKVSIMTENHAAKEILTSNVNELKTVLSNSGVTLEKFEVDMNSDFKQSMADAKNQAGSSGKRHHNREKGLFDSNGERITDPVEILNTVNQDGSLHFVA